MEPVHISGPIQEVLTDLWQKRRKRRMFDSKNKNFKHDYDRLFRIDPIIANVFLLICELADKKGQVIINEHEIADLMAARFNDPGEYALGDTNDG